MLLQESGYVQRTIITASKLVMVVVGGLFTSTELTLLLLYEWIENCGERKA